MLRRVENARVVKVREQAMGEHTLKQTAVRPAHGKLAVAARRTGRLLWLQDGAGHDTRQLNGHAVRITQVRRENAGV